MLGEGPLTGFLPSEFFLTNYLSKHGLIIVLINKLDYLLNRVAYELLRKYKLGTVDNIYGPETSCELQDKNFMDLIFFDLDGTLLNQASQISPFTKETLSLLRKKGIAFTIATGRSFISAQSVVGEHEFDLPQIYNNGVTIWDPTVRQLTLENLLTNAEVSTIVGTTQTQAITPFINVVDRDNSYYIFHSEVKHGVEEELIRKYASNTKAQICPLEALPDDSQVTNISMVGDTASVKKIWFNLNQHDNLIAYTGPALEGPEYSWLDVHHRKANKGSAVLNLKNRLNATNTVCFGDGDNDLSMFELSDESYAPENAIPEIKQAASKVIGHHHHDGVAYFLRERFSL